MQTMLHRVLIVAGSVVGTAAGLFCPSAVAQNQAIQFFDGGYAELCETAARGNDLEMPPNVELTGTRLGIEPIDLCTLAVNSAENIHNRAASYNNRGVLLFAQGAINEALSDFEQAIRIHDTLAEAYVNRGYALVALQRWEESLDAFDKGIELGTSELAKAYFNRGIAHEELGHAREAYGDYLTASELDPLWEEPKRELTRFTVRRSPGG